MILELNEDVKKYLDRQRGELSRQSYIKLLIRKQMQETEVADDHVTGLKVDFNEPAKKDTAAPDPV